MIFETREAPPFYKNGFVLGCEETRQAVLIDPGDEVEQLLAVVDEQRLEVRHILLTHAHVDHVAGLAAAKKQLDAAIWLHADDLPLYNAALEQARFFGFNIETPPPVDRFYEIPGAIEFGRYRVEVLHTPGHTPGGVSLLVGPTGRPGKKLFSGDTLFAGSIGRTDLPGGDHDTLIGSIRGVLFKLSDDVEVYPGHGPRTMIGQERMTNPFLTGERP
ncbi:MAG TPA: MBL fold metallo-hydrolase [Vicinamibacterales bacterium]|nr:MBL fold metallo-hydrolase [Acidobacteriota bacterium]HOC17930.1 MBL fold metallo-hydrolase [Vicinamibacterales bacterium]